MLRRRGDEFAVVEADPDEGRDHVANVIAATLRFSDAVPGVSERLAWLRSVQDSAVYVAFADDAAGPAASCCVMPDSELFFGSPDEADGPARPLVERAASALGYTLVDG